MASKTYIAVTIGPMYKTLYDSKRTRAVWAASYFFSWFMRSVLEQSLSKGMKIYLPYSSTVYKGKCGSGLYADRLYFEKDEKTTKEKLLAIITEVQGLVETKSSKKITADFLQQYLNIHVIEQEISEEDLKDTFTLAILNRNLDNKELCQNAPFEIENNQLQEYFLNLPGSMFLAEDAFPTTSNQRKFRSVSEIATTTLERTDTQGSYVKALREDFRSQEVDLIDQLKAHKLEVLPYQKYYAVLYADGDNIGKMLEEIERNSKDVGTFSRTLFEFGLQTERVIAEYGGNGIYLGGEDILAFLPVACVNRNKLKSQTFMHLISEIDEHFENTVIRFAKENKLTEPTLSYGVMISFVKHPLNEGMEKARKLLKKAKERKGKNSVGIWFQKHSGQYTCAYLEKSKKVEHGRYLLLNGKIRCQFELANK